MVLPEKEDIKTTKIIFMGNVAVGMTSIIHTFLEGRNLRHARSLGTGDLYRIIEVNEGGQRHKVKLNIWDTPGDASTHNLPHLFLREVQVAVLVYSITSKPSFDDLEQWIEQIEDNNEDYLLFLVGNKSDLTDQRVVPSIFGDYMVRNHAKAKSFRKTSVVNDVESILALFDEIGKEVVRLGTFKPQRNSTRL